MFHIAVALTAIGKTVEIVIVKEESALTENEKQIVLLYNEYRDFSSKKNELNEVNKKNMKHLNQMLKIMKYSHSIRILIRKNLYQLLQLLS